MNSKPQSFSDLIEGWAEALVIQWEQLVVPVLEVIVGGMDAYVDSRARAVVEQALNEHRGETGEDH